MPSSRENSTRPRDLKADQSEAAGATVSHAPSPGRSLSADKSAAIEEANAGHLATDHLLADLKRRTISSGMVTISAQGAKFALTMLSTMILARLLVPRDFGLVGMATVVTSLVRIFKDAGLSTATVQKERITHAQVSNLFWINVVVSAALSLFVAALAPAIAWFFHEPRLVPITLFLSITFLISGSTVQHMALLNRQMRFKTLAVIQIGSMTAGFLTGVGMALSNCGYWSLVGSSIAAEAVGFLLTWSASRWRPQLPVLRSGTRSLVGFGANLTVANFIDSLSRNVDTLLLGRFYGTYTVGIYSRAMALLMQPLNQLLSPVTTVFETTLSRLQGEPERYRRTFLQIYNSMALVGFTATALLLALARPVTLVLLGSQWEKTSVILAGFTGLALYAPLASALGCLLITQGRGRDLLVNSVVANFMVVTAILGGLPFGPTGVAIGWSMGALLGAMPYTYYKAGRQGPVHTQDFWLVFLKHLPVWGVVFGATFMMRLMVGDMKPLMQLLICTPVGLLAGATVIFSLSHTRRTAFQILRAASDFVGQRIVKSQAASKS
jgi:PST family polysaccharide transporter